MDKQNRLILIGNGFDLAHGLKTKYKDFLDWYMCDAFMKFINQGHFHDELISIGKKYSHVTTQFANPPKDFEEALRFISSNSYHDIEYNSRFYKDLLDSFIQGSWVNIECRYFQNLKMIFNHENKIMEQKIKEVKLLNLQFDYLIRRLTEYFEEINKNISTYKRALMDKRSNLYSVIFETESPITFVNFNYTETLFRLDYSGEDDIIHIHGRASDKEKNPIIFGYGDETDPTYQKIEDSGENTFLEHIKSFGYFKTNNYNRLISLIDSAPYSTYIVGHSCGLSDRILLSEIFEHPNCKQIEIFYHKRRDGSDNFSEITQEISRHFRPQNKNLMRRRVSVKNQKNIIPQSI